MNQSKIIVIIDDREGIPVRAIPFVTGWEIYPDKVAKNFARAEAAPWKRFEDMHAYHLQSGPANRVLPKEWGAIVAALEGFQSQTNAEAVHDDVGYAVWRAKSASLLPGGVFVWKDEFEDDWLRFWKRRIKLDEKEGDRELLYSPMMSADVRSMIFEGFENVTNGSVGIARQASSSRTSTATPPKVKAMHRDILDRAIDNAIFQAGNNKTADVWLKLKDLAMAGEPPFLGTAEGGTLPYTDAGDRTIKANGKSVALTKEALGKRLARRRENAR